MRRLLFAVLGPVLLLSPSVALAHDPLDDVSGEEDLNNPSRDTEKPRSHKKERQEQDLAKEVQDHEETEFHVTSEKEEFLRDRSETKEVKGGQIRRSQLSGGGGRAHRSAPEPRPAAHETAPETAPEPAAEPAAPPPQRGDVDPTDTSMETNAKPTVDGTPDAPAPRTPKKKKHR